MKRQIVMVAPENTPIAFPAKFLHIGYPRNPRSEPLRWLDIAKEKRKTEELNDASVAVMLVYRKV
jgi:hypothetical protein